MIATLNQPTLTPAQYHRNAQLFSDHYLDIILPKRGDRQMLALQARAVRDALCQLLADYAPSTNEAETEDKFVQTPPELEFHEPLCYTPPHADR